MERRQLLSGLVVTNTDDSGANSLRWAIQQADSGGTTTGTEIDFEIPDGDGPLTIHLASPLPVITVPVTMDGTTEADYEGTPLVEIDGSGLSGAGTDGLVLTAGDSTVSGLSLVGFTGSAIVLQAGGDNLVEGNYLGLAPSGGAAAPNQQGITLIGSSYNTIGAGMSGPGNVISGNSGDGILIEPGLGSDSSANQINGNLIGTSPAGLDAIPNGGEGIEVDGADGNMIGMPGTGLGNVISGNLGDGVELTGGASGNTIQNDLIGVGIDGRTPLGNQGDGIRLDDAPATTIGGGDPTDRNVIAANQGDGVETSGDTAGLEVAGNAIGTDVTGTLDLGNLQNGVCLASSDNTIGGSASGAANVIAFNGSGRVGAGVQLVGAVDDNSILSNSIDGNAGLGINFGSGPTPNHAPGTPGPNDYQNYPVLSLAQDDGTAITVTGTLFESPNTSYVLQFFSSPQPDPTGYGQGKDYLGSTVVETNAQGDATFTQELPPAGAAGDYLSATATDPFGNTSEFSADLAVQGQINLALSGTATPDPVVDGDNLTYALTVTNQGTADAHDVVLSDVLPTGTTVVSVTPSQGAMMPTMGGGSVVVSLGTIPVGGTATVTIVVQTGPGTIGTITDAASITSEETDPDPGAESVSIAATVETAADLSIALAADPDPVLAGGTLTDTMTVSNLGPQGSADVVAVLPIAPGLTFVSASTGTGTASFANGQVTADLGDLADGAQVVVDVVLQATVVGSVTQAATVSSESLDPDLSNNASTVTTTVSPAADLAVQVTADTAVAADGIPFDYTLTVTNNGPSVATDVAVSDTLPDGATFGPPTTTDPDATPAVTDGVLGVTFASLPAGSSAIVTIAVDPTAAPGSTLVDSATVQGDQADPDPANNADALSIPVRGDSDLSVVAAAQPGPAYAGQPLTYTIDVTNNGPDDEPDAVLSGSVPQGAVVDATSATQGADPSVSQGIMTADLGPLAAGRTAVVTLVITPGATDVGLMAAGFSVQGQNDDPDPSNNATAVDVAVGASSDLAVAIAAGQPAAIAQVDWSYTVQVTNAGPSSATGVVATIPIPAGGQLVSASSSQGTTVPGQGGAVSADLGTIASGGSATITLVIDPSAADSGQTVALAAEVSGAQYDPVPTNNQATLELPIAPSVEMTLALSSTPQVIQSGQVVDFTASVRNAGPTPATGVIVNFPAVNGLQYLGSTPSQGTPALVADDYFAQLGDLAPGASATVQIQELATTPGEYAVTASVAENQYNLDLPSASATTSADVVESPGVVEFGAPTYQVTDQSGVAILPVIRLYGASGTISVQYQTAGLNATPGLDFTPTSGTLTLGPGQWSGTIQVPVLDDPYLNHDTYLNVSLTNPAGGADLGQTTTTLVHIQDVDPDLTPPQVSNLSWSGSAQAINSLTLQFTAPLDPAFATDAADYDLTRQVGGGSIPIATISYDATDFTVTIVPQSPIASGQYARIQVVGTGADAVRDVAGNLLDGAGNGEPGSDYLAEFAQGTRLRYVDNARNTVTLSVKGPGYLEQVLDGDGDGILLNLVGMVPHRTTLKGKIKAGKRGSGQTEVGLLTGLGQFGDVKVLLKTPPFRVTQYPFQRRGKFVL